MPRLLFPSACYAIHCLQQQPNSEELLSKPNIPEFLRDTTNAMKKLGHTEAEIKRSTMIFPYIYYNVNKLANWVLYYTLKDNKTKHALLAEFEAFKETAGKSQLSSSDVGQLPILGKFKQGWLDEWMDGWMNGRMGEWVDGWVGEWVDGWVDGLIGGWMGGWMDGWVDGWLGGWMDGWMDG